MILQIEQSIWTDFVAKQAPVIIVLLVGMFGMYKYFVAQQNKKDAIISDKDRKLEEQSARVMDLYGKAIESQNRGTLVQERLLEVLKDTQDDINRLNDKIK